MAKTGKEIDPKKMPLNFEDLEMEAQIALNIYHRLGNRVAESGFVGKDYTNLPLLIEAMGVTEKLFLIDLLSIIENFYIDKSSKMFQAEMDKLKKKTAK